MKKIIKKASGVVNITLDFNNTIKHGEKHTRVFRIDDLEKISEIVDNINDLEQFKLLINFNKKEYFLFQTIKKGLEPLEIETNLLSSEYIMKLYKSFYSTEELTFDKKMLKKSKKVKKEIAPIKFDVTNSYIETDKGNYNVNVIESIDKIKAIKTLIDNNDIWLSIDFNSINQGKMLNTIAKMQKEDSFEKIKIDPFIKKHIEEFKEKLRNEEIIQCEFKVLNFNENLDNLIESNSKLILKFRQQGVNIFEVHEKVNLINAFNSSIYPYKCLEVTHSLKKEEFLELIGGGLCSEDC